MEINEAIILAGGRGTRLTTVADVPKSLAMVCGKPFIFYQLEQLKQANIKTVTIATGYKGNMFHSTLGSDYKGIKIQYSQENEALGTGGGIRFALHHLESNNFLALNGDAFLDCNLNDFISQHRYKISILLTEVENNERFGNVNINLDGQVTSYQEKHKTDEKTLISAGYYILNRQSVSIIKPNVKVSIEYDVFPDWVGQGVVGGVNIPSRFIDIGTPESYNEAQIFFKCIGI